jgi:hypothetical protein
VDGSSLASWDTAEQSVVSRSEVTEPDLSARGSCLEILPLSESRPKTGQPGLGLDPPRGVNPLEIQINKQVC